MRTRVGLFIALGLVVCAPSARAADATWQVWPEVNVYWSLQKHLRLLFVGGATREAETGERADAQAAAYVDFLALQHRPLTHFTPDAGKHSRMDFRVGYSRHADTGGGQPYHENRGIAQFQARFQPGQRPTHFLNRSRFELRDVEDKDLSWRYRNRSRLEDNIQRWGQNLTPYGMAEFFWDSSHNDWSRAIYTLGCEWSFPKGHTVLELGFNLQDELNSDRPSVYAPNITLNFHF